MAEPAESMAAGWRGAFTYAKRILVASMPRAGGDWPGLVFRVTLD